MTTCTPDEVNRVPPMTTPSFDPNDLLHEQPATHAPAAPPDARRGLSPSMWVLLIGIVAVVSVIGVAFMRSQEGQPTDGQAPDFTLTTFDGQTITLSELRGQVVIVNFWASWCGPCREEAPALERIWRAYRDRGVAVIGVTYADEDANAMAFMDEYDLTYLIGPDRGTEISGDLYNIQGVPETFIIDQAGNVHQFILAAVTEAQLIAILDQLLVEGA